MNAVLTAAVEPFGEETGEIVASNNGKASFSCDVPYSVTDVGDLVKIAEAIRDVVKGATGRDIFATPAAPWTAHMPDAEERN